MTASTPERTEILRRLQRLLFSLPEEDVAELAQLLAFDFINKLDPTELRRIDDMIESRLKKVVGPAAARFAKQWLEELRNLGE